MAKVIFAKALSILKNQNYVQRNDFCYKFVLNAALMKNVLPVAIFFIFCVTAVAGSSLPSVVELRAEYKALQGTVPDQPSREVELYPNPVTDGRLTISASDNIESVQILNITGKMVFNQDYDANTSFVYLELDKLEKGVYLVRIYFPNKEYRTEKIMIK